MMRTLELLAPARNLECGIAAIDHGADAVYIGAPRYGARAAAGNSVADIAELCRYAHVFGASVYVTVNTIIYDDELEDTIRLVHELAEAGADALLVQDMGLVRALTRESLTSGSSSPLLPLHASTQTDNRTPEKVVWLSSLGFRRVVLARELSLNEIQDIHSAAPDMELEVFVHGALCVSYSGVCYASQRCFSRSANRGECAQFCRMKFDLEDADGRVIERQRYLLSLRDLCRIDDLESLAETGVCSFKIEGRLKDVAYVKNVVSAYSRQLTRLVEQHPNRYRRSSWGRVSYSFEPNLKKTFNRGFTDYFLYGRCGSIASFDTPKAMGEYVGEVKEIGRGWFTVAGTASFANGDGLCFISTMRELEGFRVNRADGNKLFPQKMPAQLRRGMGLYRNNDVAFERLLSGKTAERKIPVRMRLSATPEGFSLRLSTTADIVSLPVDVAVEVLMPLEKQEAQKPQRENIVRQLTKLGNTHYVCDDVEIADDAACYFFPSSWLSEIRRTAVEQLEQTLLARRLREAGRPMPQQLSTAIAGSKLPAYPVPFLYNIANREAALFYLEQGLPEVVSAFELHPSDSGPLMQCRHCLRYALGYCVRNGGERPFWHEPLILVLGDGRRFPLEFDCKHCQMNVYGDENE